MEAHVAEAGKRQGWVATRIQRYINRRTQASSLVLGLVSAAVWQGHIGSMAGSNRCGGRGTTTGALSALHSGEIGSHEMP